MRCGEIMIADHDVHLPETSGIDSTDPDLIRKYLDGSYDARFSIERLDHQDGPCSCTHSRIDVGRYALEEVHHDGDVRLSAEHVPVVVALSVLSGRVECGYGELSATAGPGETVLAMVGGDGVRVRVTRAHLRTVVLDRSLLADAAGAGNNDPPIRFTGLKPVNEAMAEMFRNTQSYVAELLSGPETSENTLLLGGAGRMLASALLAAFPNDAPLQTSDGAGIDREGHPIVLRQAIDFIEANAARDIGIGDIATAVYLTPRTVQYMFRRHLDTTPTAFLRGVRLERARQELFMRRRGETTVAAAAARWGFAHTGRFAVLYRQEYGESPHETLRR
jgi:AraC-like DNA-binding protein